MASEERCMCCGEIIPEGMQVCDKCMNERSEQWKRGGICAACRRQEYCRKQCRPNRAFMMLRIREYIRKKLNINQISNALHPDGEDAQYQEQEE